MGMEKEFLVEQKHSATEVGSGDLNVLSTPSMVAFMENTAKEAVEQELEDSQTTVGIELSVQHLKATAIGKTVRVQATLIEQKKNILVYKIEAYEGKSLVGKGVHKRAIVEETIFMENL